MLFDTRALHIVLCVYSNATKFLMIVVIFSPCLQCCVQVLVQFPQVQLSEVYQLIHAHLESTGGIKGHEERGIYFGRVFALLALLRSGRLKTSVSL